MEVLVAEELRSFLDKLVTNQQRKAFSQLSSRSQVRRQV
jgi:hypothetical protein